MNIRFAALFLAPLLMLAGCSMFSSRGACIDAADGSKVCTITDPAMGLTTRTVERGDKLYISTCQMSQCSPFEELPAGQKPMSEKAAAARSSHEP